MVECVWYEACADVVLRASKLTQLLDKLYLFILVKVPYHREVVERNLDQVWPHLNLFHDVIVLRRDKSYLHSLACYRIIYVLFDADRGEIERCTVA